MLPGPDDGTRRNYFHQRQGEDTNVAPVVYRAQVPESSVGWTEGEFFANLGHPRNAPESTQRKAEQEYLLQGLSKGAMFDASRIAGKFGFGISVRPTGLLAHMGIESGDPTKAQEFKNKTSKEVDLFLCDELQWKDLGAVVHYNPRVGWRARIADVLARVTGTAHAAEATEGEWLDKRRHILNTRMPALAGIRPKLTLWPETPADWQKVRATFFDRAKEYAEEDHSYRSGRYAAYTELVGPYVRLRLRPETNMVGDHDLFGFTRNAAGYGILVPDTTLGNMQTALQESHAFQAQHGGIWNWEPTAEFNEGIKTRIMASHSAPDGDPLIHILPGGEVHAVFYDNSQEVLVSVWDSPAATKWRSQTPSGKHLRRRNAIVSL